MPDSPSDHGRRDAGIPRGLTLAIALLLVALPLATYWNTTFHEFGLRDDYSNLCEAREQPGKILHFIASHARPLYLSLIHI